MLGKRREGREQEDQSAKKMAMDIDRLVVEIEETLERAIVGVRSWPIVAQYIRIVALPFR